MTDEEWYALPWTTVTCPYCQEVSQCKHLHQARWDHDCSQVGRVLLDIPVSVTQ